jgi:hypothetical protein
LDSHGSGCLRSPCQNASRYPNRSRTERAENEPVTELGLGFAATTGRKNPIDGSSGVSTQLRG